MTPVPEIHESNLTQTVLKALDILECLATAKRPLTAPEVARLCGMSRPTVYRLLTTLLSRGYVVNVENAHYQLGSKILSLGRGVLDAFDLPELGKPYLQQLSELSNETAYLSILEDTEILYLGKVESAHSVRLHSAVGSRMPLHCSAMGKAILAFLPPDEQSALIDRLSLTRFTAQTLTDKASLCRDLALTRARGFSIDNREGDEGVCCVGAPIFDHTGRPFAGVSISGPAYRLPLARLEELAAAVIEATQAISGKLGYGA